MTGHGCGIGNVYESARIHLESPTLHLHRIKYNSKNLCDLFHSQSASDS